MADAVTLVLKNAADVNVNYYPVVIRTGDEAVYVDRTNSTIAMQSKARFTLRETKTVRNVTGRVTYPYYDSIDGVTLNQSIASFSFVIPLNMTATQRTDVRKRLIAQLSDAVTTALVENGESPW